MRLQEPNSLLRCINIDVLQITGSLLPFFFSFFLSFFFLCDQIYVAEKGDRQTNTQVNRNRPPNRSSSSSFTCLFSLSCFFFVSWNVVLSLCIPLKKSMVSLRGNTFSSSVGASHPSVMDRSIDRSVYNSGSIPSIGDRSIDRWIGLQFKL